MTTDKYCDCAQGRWPCTCMPRGRTTTEMVRSALEWDEATNPQATDIYAETAKAIKGRPGYWERLATDKAKLFALKCAEFDVLNARLRVYQGVALIGWAGFILVLLGV